MRRRSSVGLASVLVALGLLASCSASPPGTGPRRTGTDSRTPERTGVSPDPSARTPSSAPLHLSVGLLPWRLPRPLAREAVIPTPDGLVVAGGLVAGDQSTATAYRLDLSTGRASSLPALPVAVHDVGGAVVGGRPEVLGGGNSAEQDVVQQEHADGSWAVVAHLPQPRSDLAAVTVGNQVFVIGGYDGIIPARAEVLVSARGGPYRVFARLPQPVRYAAVALADGAIWVIGGERSGLEIDAIQRLDLHTGRARVVGHLPHPLGHAVAVRLGNRVLLAGGRPTGSTVTAAMWWLDPASPGRVRPAGRLPTPLADAAITLVGGSAYLVGGETPDLSNRVVRLALRPSG